MHAASKREWRFGLSVCLCVCACVCVCTSVPACQRERTMVWVNRARLNVNERLILCELGLGAIPIARKYKCYFLRSPIRAETVSCWRDVCLYLTSVCECTPNGISSQEWKSVAILIESEWEICKPINHLVFLMCLAVLLDWRSYTRHIVKDMKNLLRISEQSIRWPVSDNWHKSNGRKEKHFIEMVTPHNPFGSSPR